MRIQYIGFQPSIRVVKTYTWNAANDYTCTVDDAETIADVLSNPGPDFVVANDDPLLVLGVPQEACLGLAMAGIASHIALAAVSDIPAVASVANLPERDLRAWQRTAKRAQTEED
jgi:hypothetical protein